MALLVSQTEELLHTLKGKGLEPSTWGAEAGGLL